MKDLSKIVKKNSELAWRIIDNETIIIPLDEQSPETEKINFLNETATRIWELIDGKNSIKDIIIKICQEYEVEKKEAEKEVVNFINKLLKEKLIKIEHCYPITLT